MCPDVIKSGGENQLNESAPTSRKVVQLISITKTVNWIGVRRTADFFYEGGEFVL